MRAEADLLLLVRAHAPVRRAMAALAHRLIASRAWERLGFARLRDYAVERLGYSARSVHDLANVHGALAKLPRVDAAFVRGDIPWTTARLLARVATAGDDETRWLDRARRMTAAALAHEVRKVDVGAVERDGLGLDDADGGVAGYGNVIIRCTAQVQGKWYRARQLAWRVVGHPVRPWECAEMVAAEVLSALPPEGDAGDGGATSMPAGMPPRSDCSVGSDADVGHGAGTYAPRAAHCAETMVATANATIDGASGAEPALAASAPGILPTADTHDASHSALLALTQSLVKDLDAAGPFQLDRRLRRAVRLEQRIDAEIGARLALVTHEHLHLAYGYTRFDDYVRERLGLAPRKMRALLRLERACRLSVPLADAYRDGRLSWVQAHAVLPALLFAHCRPRTDAWVRWALRVSVRRLQDDVELALLLNETDPEAFAATAGLPEAARDLIADDGEEVADRSRQRQIGAQPTVSGETTRLFFHAPRGVVTLFRAVLCTVRRAIERQTGKMPTEGEAFDAMLEHANDAWMPPGSRVRAAHRVFARDGWRCTAPGCSSFQNLHDHHIVFRSAGGSDDLANRTTLCAWHHLRGVHAGVVRCAGAAPDALRFELGLRGLLPPLLTFAPGERLG